MNRRPTSLPGQRSQALLEFALVLPLLLMLIFGIMDTAMLFQAWLTVENIARQSVRYAVTGQYDTAYCVDTPDDADLDACAGENYIPEQNAARLQTLIDNPNGYAYRQSVGLFFHDANITDQGQIGYLDVTVCSSRDANGNGDHTDDFTFYAPNRLEYARCTPTEDPGDPGDRVIIAVDYNHPLLTPFLNKAWPYIHLSAYRQGIVEMFRVPRVIALPPLVGLPTSTASNTPPPSATPTNTATATLTSTALPIYIEIVSPDPSGQVITNVNQTPFEAIAYNPPYGTDNGDGIQSIRFWFSGPSSIPARTEGVLRYCAFSGNGPCNYISSVMDYTTLVNGEYTMYAQATGVDGRVSVTVSKTFIINFPPTPTPTATRTFTATPTPSCTNIYVNLTRLYNDDFQVRVRNDNVATAYLTESNMTWSSPYAPPLYFNLFSFGRTYYNPTGSVYTSPVEWETADGGSPEPLYGGTQRIWSADFDLMGQPLHGSYSVVLTFTFPDWGDCVLPAASTDRYTPTATLTRTPTRTPTRTLSPTITRTPTRTLSPTITRTPTRTGSPTITRTPTRTGSPTSSPTRTLSPTVTRTPTRTATGTNTPTRTNTVPATSTHTPTPSGTPSKTPTIGGG
ncbi:MAG: TadE/TadG family type IV pilus assembly protein [Chloroflexota bacterium]